MKKFKITVEILNEGTTETFETDSLILVVAKDENTLNVSVVGNEDFVLDAVAGIDKQTDGLISETIQNYLN